MTKPELLEILHSLIDKKFKRKNRSELIERHRLEQQITLWSICDEIIDSNPAEICLLFKQMIAEKSVVTNMSDDFSVYPFDAYFLPASEINEKS